MTMDIALGLVPVSPRGGERGGGKAGKEEAGGFDAALAGKAAKAAPHGRDAGQNPRPWKLAAYGDHRMALPMPVEPGMEAVPDDVAGTALPLARKPQAALQTRDDDRAAEQDAATAFPDDDMAEAAFVAIPPPRHEDARAPRAEAADAEKTEESATLRTMLQAASGGGERQAAGDGERPAQQQPERPAAVVHEGRPAPQAPASAPTPTPAPPSASTATPAPPPAMAAPGEAGHEPERARLAGGAATPPSSATISPEPGNGPARMPVNVLGFSTSSAPVMPLPVAAAQLSTTAAGVVAAIEAEPTWRAAAAEAAVSQRAQPHFQAQGTVSSLRIQLNPAELGMVTARLVATGSQLEIEIRVESNDARQRLANDADAIVKALRGVGYDIERVTIQQAPQGGNGAQQQGAAGRDPFAQQDQQPRDGAGANAGGRNGREEADNGGTARRHAGETAAQRPGGGVYI